MRGTSLKKKFKTRNNDSFKAFKKIAVEYIIRKRNNFSEFKFVICYLQ